MSKKAEIFYFALPEEKLEWFRTTQFKNIPFERITPDKNHNLMIFAQQVQSLSHPSEFIVELLRNALQPTEAEKHVKRFINEYNLSTQRVPGLGNGDIWISEDFDAPLPDEFWFGEKS